MKIFDISKFRVVQTVLEFRHAENFYVWDRAGAIWLTLRDVFDGLKGASVEPNSQHFVVGDNLELLVSIQQTRIISHFMKNDDFIDAAKLFAKAVFDLAPVDAFTRVGLRQIYAIDYKSKEDVAREMLELPILSVPQERVFGIDDGQIVGAEYAARRENEDLGVLIRLLSHYEKFEVGIPPQFKDDGGGAREQIGTERWQLRFDIDYYTKNPIHLGQFSVEKWLKNGLHVIRRDAAKCMGGS